MGGRERELGMDFSYKSSHHLVAVVLVDLVKWGVVAGASLHCTIYIYCPFASDLLNTFYKSAV